MEIEDLRKRRQRFIREETQILDYFKPREALLATTKPKSNRASRMTEREEVPAILPRMRPTILVSRACPQDGGRHGVYISLSF
jgi:hypothetical protein